LLDSSYKSNFCVKQKFVLEFGTIYSKAKLIKVCLNMPFANMS